MSEHAVFSKALKTINLHPVIEFAGHSTKRTVLANTTELASVANEQQKYLESLWWRRPLLTTLSGFSQTRGNNGIALRFGVNLSGGLSLDDGDLHFAGRDREARLLGGGVVHHRGPAHFRKLWPTFFQTLIKSRCPISELAIGCGYWPVRLDSVNCPLSYSDDDFDAVVRDMRTLDVTCAAPCADPEDTSAGALQCWVSVHGLESNSGGYPEAACCALGRCVLPVVHRLRGARGSSLVTGA